MVHPVSTQCVIVDLKFTGGTLYRCSPREKPLDPHAFEDDYTLDNVLFANLFAVPSVFLRN